MAFVRDPLFPLVPPPFMFPHRVTIVRASAVVVDTTDDGWPIIPGNVPTVSTAAYVAQPTERTPDPDGEILDVVVLVPNGTTVHHRDVVDIPSGQAMHPTMVGRFRITQVRPNAAHTRVLATRVIDPAGAEA